MGVSLRRNFVPKSLVALSLGLGLAPITHAQTAPPATSPGAAQPVSGATTNITRPVNESLLNVPPVIDRPLGIDEGPKIPVTRFVLDGASDHPDHGLTLASLQAILDAALKTQPAEGYTVNQLQKIAEGVSAAYRAKGYVLCQSFVPAQDVRNGEIHVQVLEGRLGAISVEGNKHFRTSALEAPFTSALHSAVNQDDVESRLLRLSSYPGLTVFGVFTPGKAVGDSDLVLKVQREKVLDLEVGADNFGSAFNGEYRGRLGVGWNSPLGLGDRLSLSFLKAGSSSSASGADTKYYAGDYRLPFAAGRGAFTLAANSNDYVVGGQLAGFFSGRARTATAGFEWETSRSRLGRTFFYVHGDTKKGDFNTTTGLSSTDILAQEKLTDGEVGVGFDRIDRAGKGRWTIGLSALHGTNSNSGSATIRPESDSSYTVERLSIERMQWLSRFTTLHLRLAGQLTSNVLPTLEETALGGPSTVRAYEVARFVADKSMVGTLEYYIGAPGFASKPGPGGQPWGQTFQVVLFGDFGRGWINGNATSVATQRDLKGAGLGFAFSLPHRFTLRVDGSKAISPTASDRSQPYFKETRIYASLGLMF